MAADAADRKAFCFMWTLNNYTPEEEALIQSMTCRFLIYEHEIAPETGTPHLQGYVQFDTQKRFNQVKNMLGGRAHVERAKNGPEVCIKYCTKDNTGVFRKGEPNMRKGQGKRNDLEDACELINETKSIKELALQYPTTFVKYHRGFKELVNTLTEDRDYRPEVIYAWGETGVGKTRSVCLKEKGKIYIKTDDGKEWFDFYDPNIHEAILIDEFTGKMKPEFINRLCDYAPFQVEVKGGYTKMLVKRLYILSNYSFEEATNMGNWTEVQKACVKRRIQKFVHVVKFPGTEFNDWLKPAEVIDMDLIPDNQLDDDEVFAIFNAPFSQPAN